MADSFTIELRQQAGYDFKVEFGEDLPAWVLDEPAPTGSGHGPSASRVLAAAVTHCLSASLLYCLQKSHRAGDGIRASATCHYARNDEGRLRIGGLDVRITLPTEDTGRCLDLFEDYCVVTESVRQGIPVTVTVVDAAGGIRHRHD